MTKNTFILVLVVLILILGISLYALDQRAARFKAESRITQLEFARPETLIVTKTIPAASKPKIIIRPVPVRTAQPGGLIASEVNRVLQIAHDSLLQALSVLSQSRKYVIIDSLYAASDMDSVSVKYVETIFDDRLLGTLEREIVFDPIQIKSKLLIPARVQLPPEEISWYDNFQTGVAATLLVGVLICGTLLIYH